MKAHKNTITFNGHVYDATTGKAVDIVSKPAQKAPARSLTQPAIIKPSVKKSTDSPKVVAIPVHDANRATGQKATTIHVKTERPKTLMRAAVTKPARALRPTVAGMVAQPSRIVINGSEADRQERVVHSLQSKHISKFAQPSHTVVHRTAEIPVKVPTAAPSKHSAYNIEDTPPAPRVSASASHHHPRENIFEAALASASSHQEKTHRHKKHSQKHGPRIAAGLASIALLVGFFAYQNAPKIALSRASSEIGFNARTPSFHPAGFAQSGAVQYQKGLVVINFHSNSDDRAYTLTQAHSSANNASLGSDYLAGQKKTYEVASTDGGQVYIYDGSNATWIKNGVWYTIEGNAQLSRNQLLQIVGSI